MLCAAKARLRAPGHARRHLRLARAAVTADRASLDITKMAALGERILVKPLEAEETTAGGVLLPSNSAPGAAQEAQVGEVVSVGDKVQLDLKAGDTVLFSKYGTSDVEITGGKVVFVSKDSVLGVCV